MTRGIEEIEKNRRYQVNSGLLRYSKDLLLLHKQRKRKTSNNNKTPMKQILLFFTIAALAMVGCTSNEKKAEKLINDYMFKHLHDYDSYEIVETKIDTAYNMPQYNDSILNLAMDAAEYLDDAHHFLSESESAQSSMEIWSDGYSSYSRSKWRDARKEYIEKTEKYALSMDKAADKMLEINRIASTLDNSQMIGWKVSHKFRSNNRAGNKMLGTYTFITDKDFKSIITNYDDEDEDLIELYEVIVKCLYKEEVDGIKQGATALLNKIATTK